jgi:hypothetical protein
MQLGKAIKKNLAELEAAGKRPDKETLELAKHLAPEGHRKIEECCKSMRGVAHLWAAERLAFFGEHRSFLRYLTYPRNELLDTSAGIEKLVRMASGVQRFALGYVDPQNNKPVDLLGPEPWLVPNRHTNIPWTWAPSELLWDSLESYSRRPRG